MTPRLLIDDPKERLPRVTALWGFFSVDANGDEGLVAAHIGGSWMPLIAADEKRLESLRELAERVAKESGKRIVVAKFTRRIDEETIWSE